MKNLTVMCKYILSLKYFFKIWLASISNFKVQVLNALYIEVQKGFTFSIKMDLSNVWCHGFDAEAPYTFWLNVKTFKEWIEELINVSHCEFANSLFH